MKKIICYCVYVFLALCLTGCREIEQQEERWNGKEVYLTAETIHSDREILQFSAIVLFNDHLVLNSHEKDRFFSLFELHGDSIKYVNNFLSIGRGPYEVSAANGYYLPEENLFCIIGYNHYGKNMYIPLDDPDNLFNHGTWTVSENNLTGNGIEIIPINSHSLMTMRAKNDDNMFSVIDLNDNLVEDLRIVIPDNINAPPIEKLLYIYNGRIRKRPYHDQFAYSPQNGNLVKVFELTDNKVSSSFDIFDELPKYHYDGNKIRRERENKSGLRPEVTERYIYLGDTKYIDAMGDRAEEIKGYRRGYMKEVYVSDWNGNPVAKYMLDVPVVYHTVDKDDKYLYAFTYDKDTLEDRLVRFRLPALQK